MTTIFYVFAVETVLRILGIIDTVPRAPFTPFDLQSPKRLRNEERIALLCKFQESRTRRECECRFVLLVVCLRVLLITDHVLLVSLIGTPNTVFAGMATPKEITIRAILTILTEKKCVTVCAVDALVTSLTLVAHGRIDRITRLLQEIAVITILTEVTFCDQITIFQVSRRIIEVAILHRAWCIEERHVRNNVE